MIYTRIAGTGSYLPEHILTNQDLEQRIETSDRWIVERTGIRERRIAAHDETASTMGGMAARNAMEAADISAQDIDLIIVATCSPDKSMPSTACLIQQQLGVNVCPAFDVGAVCSGFSYALAVADQFIRAGKTQCALVIGTEKLSKLINWEDRGTCILFGDGAGAVILKPDTIPGILSTHLYADGGYKDLLYTDTLGSYVHMEGREVFKIAVPKLEQMALATLGKEKLDWLIPHQANLRIIQAVAKKLNLPMEQVVVTVDTHGNTSAASIPLALDAAVRDGRIQRGQLLLLESFGAGFTWGSALIRY
ncbi:MAG: beta-ketoacyl-ACP synthase III [Gammaproteobacteria bacterium]